MDDQSNILKNKQEGFLLLNFLTYFKTPLRAENI